jgi:hypothetical protein
MTFIEISNFGDRGWNFVNSQAERPRDENSSPDGVKNFSLLYLNQIVSGLQPASYEISFGGNEAGS